MATSPLKLAATVVSTSEGTFLRSDLATLRLAGEDVGAFAETIVPLLDGTRTAEEIAQQLPEHDPESVLGFLAQLEQQGFVERAGDDDSGWRAQERFLSAWRGQQGDHMRVLREASVVVVGLEPWGVTLARELAASGVGRLHLCDESLVSDDDLLGTRIFSADVSGSSRADALEEALDREAPLTTLTTGAFEELPLAGDCDLVVGALAPDELGSWLTLARACHRAGARSMSGYLQGREAVIGPLVIPGQTACWNCSRLRQLANASRPEDERTFQDAVLENPPPPRPRAYLATMPPLVGQLTALEAVKFLIGESSPLMGRVLVHDLMTAEATLHTLVRVPWCEVCGETHGGPRSAPFFPPGTGGSPSPARPDARAEGRHGLDDLEGPDELRDALAGFVDSWLGIVSRLTVARPKIDEPQLPFFSSAILSTFSQARHRSWQPERGFGKGLTRIDAALSAVGEAIERYSACQWPTVVRKAPLGELDGEALDPRELTFYSDEQYADPDFPYTAYQPERSIDWVRGRWLNDGSPVWVPALAAYLHYPAPPAEAFGPITTNGLAARTSTDDAALRAVLELLERDSFSLAWLSMSAPRPLAVEGALSGATAEALRQLERYAGRIEFYLLDTEVPIHVVACVSSGDGEQWPGSAVALGTDLSPTAAVRKALLEQAQVGLTVRRAMRAGKMKIPGDRDEVHTEIDHMAYYVPAERAGALDFWRTSKRETVELGSLPQPETNSLAGLQALLERSALRVAVVDVTAPDVADGPFRVARALGPGIQQINFGFREAELGNPRLNLTGGINPEPHPLG